MSIKRAKTLFAYHGGKKTVHYDSINYSFVLRKSEVTLGTCSGLFLIVAANLTVIITSQHQFFMKSRSSRPLFLIDGWLSSTKETTDLGVELAPSPHKSLAWHVDSITGSSLMVAQTAKGL